MELVQKTPKLLSSQPVYYELEVFNVLNKNVKKTKTNYKCFFSNDFTKIEDDIEKAVKKFNKQYNKNYKFGNMSKNIAVSNKNDELDLTDSIVLVKLNCFYLFDDKIYPEFKYVSHKKNKCLFDLFTD